MIYCAINAIFALYNEHYNMTKNTKGKLLNRRLEEILSIVGEQLKLARLRRNLSIEQIAERVQCSRNTVAQAEKGSPTVSIGIYARILYALQLEDDLLHLALDDKMGRMVQDLELKQRQRASKK